MNTILTQFSIEPGSWNIQPITTGWINTTYQVVEAASGRPRYILQCINHHIFQDVEMLQNNIQAVTCHIRSKLEAKGVTDLDRRVVRLIPTIDNKLYHFDGERYWRMMLFINDSYTHEELTEQSAYSTGKTFGEFQSYLVDITEPIGETIPNFHNMEFRYKQFQEALAADPKGRYAEVKTLVKELEERAEEMCKCERLFAQGELPKRINHCDTKVNNILFDADGEALCVIDLDTVMPNFVTSDYGDFMRTAGNMGAEDDANLDSVGLNVPIFKAFTRGYMETAGSFLQPIERELLPFGAKLLPYMQTVRFLGDYINGDTYYKILHPTHNLQRSYAQMALVKSMESHEEEMKRFIEEL